MLAFPSGTFASQSTVLNAVHTSVVPSAQEGFNSRLQPLILFVRFRCCLSIGRVSFGVTLTQES